MRIVIFGIGNTGKDFYKKMKMSMDIYTDNIVAFSDNNQNLWGTYYEEIPIMPPYKITGCSFDIVVIASGFEQDIYNQLCEYGFKNKIMLMSEYSRMAYTRYRYKFRYQGESIESRKVFDEKIIVYTSITGNYDELNEPLVKSSNIEYVCFTNNRNLTSKVWNIEYISSEILNDMYLAKRVKLFPDEFLSGFNTSVWVDGKFQIVGDINEYIMLYQKTKPILCFPHFERACVYEEAAKCIADGIGNKEDIVHQVANYERQRYPFDNGLYEMGCIVRNHNDEEVKKMMFSWWEEIRKYSFRDQISFPYICWKENFLPDICDQDIYKNKWLLCKRNYSKVK